MATPLYPNHTVEEFDIHVLRALGLDTYNYRTKGDVSLNSPGNLDLAVINANKFMLNPMAELTNPAVFALGYDTEPVTMKNCLDAAYIAALMRYAANVKATPITAAHIAVAHTAAQYAAQVKAVVLAQIARPETDFTKYVLFNDKAGWVLAGFIYKLVGAAQLSWDDFSHAEKASFNAYIANVGIFYAKNLHKGIGGLYPNRLVGDYTPRKGQPSQTGELVDPKKSYTHTHVTSAGVAQNELNRVGSHFNNRRGLMAALLSKIACHFRFYKYAMPVAEVVEGAIVYKATLDKHAKCYFKEWVDYGVYPGGMQAEFERGIQENPNKGFNYAADNLDCAVMIAANFARLGDVECFEYESYLGLLASKGGPKSLKGALTTFYKMCNGEYAYYYKTVTPLNRYRQEQFQDGKNLWYVSDTRFIEANLYYKLDLVTQTYTRNPARYTVPYPSGKVNNLVGSIAGQPPFSGSEQVRPVGNLFLFGQLENRVNPFLLSKTKQTITFPEIAGKTFGEGAFSLFAQAGSGLPVSFSLVSGPATLLGGVVTITGAGELVVRASQAGNATYEAAPDVDQTIPIEKASQLITFSAIADKQLSVDGPFALVAISSANLPITFDIQLGIGSIAGDVFTPGGVGAVTLIARQDGNDTYKPASAIQSFKVTPAPAKVTTNILLGKYYTLSSNGSAVPARAFTNGLSDSALVPTEFYATFDFDQFGTGMVANKIVIKFKTPIAKFKMQYRSGTTWIDWVTCTGNKLKEVIFPMDDKALNMPVRFVGVGKNPEYHVNEIEIWAYKS